MKTWPYDSFGTPGKVAERTTRADVGATFVRFANGVRLTVKPTNFRKDQVQVQVRIGDGKLDLPKDKPTAAWPPSAFHRRRTAEGHGGRAGPDHDQAHRRRVVRRR